MASRATFLRLERFLGPELFLRLERFLGPELGTGSSRSLKAAA